MLNQRPRGVQSQAVHGQGVSGCVGVWGRVEIQASIPLPCARLIPSSAYGSAVSSACVACVTRSGFCLLIQSDSGPLGQPGFTSTTSVHVTKELGTDDKSLTFLSKGVLQNFATVWRVAQVQTAVSCRLGTHMTQRKLSCKQTRCDEQLPCSHSLLVQRSDNSLCKMAAGHVFFGELRWGGVVS